MKKEVMTDEIHQKIKAKLSSLKYSDRFYDWKTCPLLCEKISDEFDKNYDPDVASAIVGKAVVLARQAHYIEAFKMGRQYHRLCTLLLQGETI